MVRRYNRVWVAGIQLDRAENRRGQAQSSTRRLHGGRVANFGLNLNNVAQVMSSRIGKLNERPGCRAAQKRKRPMMPGQSKIMGRASAAEVANRLGLRRCQFALHGVPALLQLPPQLTDPARRQPE